MARIRTIKPEFYSSPGIETLDFAWRILYIAMWNWADDTGRGTSEARELMGFAFPLDEEMTIGEFRRGLGEVRRVFGVTFYKVDGRSYYAIPAWDKHQKIDKRSGSRWPSPDDGEPYDPLTNSAPTLGSKGDSWVYAETPPRARGKLGAGTGEQGNRGTGEQGHPVVKLSDAEAPDHDDEKFLFEEEPNEEPRPDDKTTTSGYPDDFKTFWDTYPRRGGKGAACTAFLKAKKRAPVEAILAGAERMKNDPNLPADGTLVALPATWLNQDRWEDDPLPPRLTTGQQFKSSADQRLERGAQLMEKYTAIENNQLALEGGS